MRVTHRLASNSLAAIPSEAAWAESIGYDALSKNETAHDSFIPLTLAATSTTRAMLQTSVAIAFPRSPMITAYTARDLQDLSQGRFRLGVGTQVKGHIERRFSTSWESPGPRLREYVQALKAIWSAWDTGERLNFNGKHYQFSLMTPFFSPGPGEFPAPPVFTAAVNAYNCRVAGEVADGLMLHSLTSPEYVRDVVRPALADGAKRSSRDADKITVSGGGFLITGPNRASLRAAQAEVRRRIASMPQPAPIIRSWHLMDSKRLGSGCMKCPCAASGPRWVSWSAMRCCTHSPYPENMMRLRESSPAAMVGSSTRPALRCIPTCL